LSATSIFGRVHPRVLAHGDRGVEHRGRIAAHSLAADFFVDVNSLS